MLPLKSAYQDATTPIVMSPLEFLQRLAALVPRPRLHLIRFHGVLAPHAKLCAQIVAAGSENETEPLADQAHTRHSPARLLKRVFDIGIEHCPECGGALKIIAAIEDPPVIVRILAHLGCRPGLAQSLFHPTRTARRRRRGMKNCQASCEAWSCQCNLISRGLRYFL